MKGHRTHKFLTYNKYQMKYNLLEIPIIQIHLVLYINIISEVIMPKVPLRNSFVTLTKSIWYCRYKNYVVITKSLIFTNADWFMSYLPGRKKNSGCQQRITVTRSFLFIAKFFMKGFFVTYAVSSRLLPRTT